MADMSGEAQVAGSTTPHRKIRIGDLLVSNGVISEAQLMSALAEQKKTGQKLGNTLIDSGFIDENRLLEFLSQQLQIPLIDLSSHVVDRQVVRLLPERGGFPLVEGELVDPEIALREAQLRSDLREPLPGPHAPSRPARRCRGRTR